MKILRTLGLFLLSLILLVNGIGKLVAESSQSFIGLWGELIGVGHILAAALITFFAGHNAWRDWKMGAKSTSGRQNVVTLTMSFAAVGVLVLFVLASVWEGAGLLYLLEAVWLTNFQHWSTVALSNYNFQYPVTVMIAGSLQVLSATLCFVVVVLGVRMLLDRLQSATGVLSDVASTIRIVVFQMLNIISGIPYIVALIVSRVLFETLILFVSAWQINQTMASQIAFTRPLFISGGITIAAIFLGSQIAVGLWQWCEEEVEDIESTPYGRLAKLSDRARWQLLFREVLWIEKWERFIQQLLTGLAGIVLIDVLSNAVCDLFSSVSSFSIPLYPGLGNFQFYNAGNSFDPLPEATLSLLQYGLMGVLFLLVVIICGSSLPLKPPRFVISGDCLILPNKKVLLQHPHLHLPQVGVSAPSINFVLGGSGTGKTSLLRALRASSPSTALYFFQDPDDALPEELSIAEVVQMSSGGDPDIIEKIEELLQEHISDERVFAALHDRYTQAQALSRGERQRLLFCIGWAILEHRLENGELGLQVFLDEFSSAQDCQRTSEMWRVIKQTLHSHRDAFSLFVTTHDPECLRPKYWDTAGNRTFWLTTDSLNPDYSRLTVLDRLDEDWLPDVPETESVQAFQSYRRYVQQLLDPSSLPPTTLIARGQLFNIALPKSGSIAIGPNRLSYPLLKTFSHGFTLLKGPSGTGKSTLLSHIIECSLRSSSYSIGWVPQDPGRAFPEKMIVVEALGIQSATAEQKQRIRELFGAKVPWQQTIASLSEGQRQRIAIIREQLRLNACAKRQILLMDEPFGSLDPENHIRLMDLFCEWLREENSVRSIVMISHTPDIEERLANHNGIPIDEWVIA